MFPGNPGGLVILQKRIIRIINKSHCNTHTDPIFKYLGILKINDTYLHQQDQFMFSCKNSFLPPKAINSTLIQYKKFPGMPSTVLSKKTLRSSRPFFKDLSFLIYLTSRSSSLNPFSLLTKYWRLNYWVNMKTVHKSFHLRLFAIFSSIDVNRPSRFSLLDSVKPFHVQKWPKLIKISKLHFAKCWKTVPGNCMKVFS